jgi:hypothetical protein
MSNTWTTTADRRCAEHFLATSVTLLRAMCANDAEAGQAALDHAADIEAWFVEQGVTTNLA